MKKLSIIFFLIISFFGTKAFSQDKKPNILVILADDLGYATTGVYTNGKSKLSTPNIDSIAKEGVTFTDGYVTASVCGPSRSGLLTGRYQQRFGIYANFDTQRGPGVPASEKVMGTYFKEAGYRTAAIGKWHIGVKQPGQHPIDRGFDKYYGFNSAQTDYFNSPILFDGKTKVKKHKYLTFQFTDEAIDFIEKGKEEKEPFFMYLAYNAVHGPNQAPKDYIAKYTAKGFPKKVATQMAMVDALDEGVGRVLKTLKENGLEENTLVYFLSDNGGLPAWWKGSNAPWKGFKREQWEGGCHVQFLMKWPGKIPKGEVCKDMVYSLDILTTSLAAANIEKPKDITLDGENILTLFSAKNKAPLHKSLFWAGSHVPRSGGAHKKKEKDLPYRKDDAPAAWTVRSGKWKLVQITELGEPQLYNLEKDPTESKNVAHEQKGIVKKLSKEFSVWFKDKKEPIAWNKKYYLDLQKIK
ncbi:putative sulfatase [Maribacter vaceletii]|uniref:Putative sulfatase n=1 Tax=Maribacter vaceletii TaxID=1206816 RepID=A0A495E9C4_9FLAO|nr:sulfatase-like hydrolase/transferase [Maribacter vaceletii]RKR13271.1 putative sulfatase [Maribacter vaceletii]